MLYDDNILDKGSINEIKSILFDLVEKISMKFYHLPQVNEMTLENLDEFNSSSTCDKKSTFLRMDTVENTDVDYLPFVEAFDWPFDHLSQPTLYTDLEVLPFAHLCNWSTLFPNEEKDGKHKKKRKKNLKRSYKFSSGDGISFKKNKINPNHFIAIRINNSKVVAEVNAVQQELLKKEERLKPACVDVNKLHVTLIVLNIGNDEDMLKVKSAMDEAGVEVTQKSLFNEAPLIISGVNHFNRKVLYCDIENSASEALKLLVGFLEEHLIKNGFPLTDNTPFTPHITIMKMSRSPKRLKKEGLSRIEPELFSSMSQRVFGGQHVQTIELCDMRANEGTYYKVKHSAQIVSDSIINKISVEEVMDNIVNTVVKGIKPR